jgi:hypothetical protein
MIPRAEGGIEGRQGLGKKHWLPRRRGGNIHLPENT